MAEIDDLIQQLNQSGKDVFWHGKASQASIDKLESLLGSQLPSSFKSFLAQYGGGGVVEQEVSGIEDDDPMLEHRGTVYGDTLLCRKDHALPKNLIVIYLGTGDAVWCLDVSRLERGECPVVSFDVSSKRTKSLAANFDEFMVEYLKIRLSARL